MPAGKSDTTAHTGKVLNILQSAKTQNVPVSLQDFTSWGDQAKDAQSQGWYKEVDFDGEVHYKSRYDNAFNKVLIPGQKNGYIAVIGHPNKTMDVVIKDSGGNIIQNIIKGGTPADVQNYTKKLVQSRDESIRKGTNPDKPDASGGYTTL